MAIRMECPACQALPRRRACTRKAASLEQMGTMLPIARKNAVMIDSSTSRRVRSRMFGCLIGGALLKRSRDAGIDSCHLRQNNSVSILYIFTSGHPMSSCTCQ